MQADLNLRWAHMYEGTILDVAASKFRNNDPLRTICMKINEAYPIPFTRLYRMDALTLTLWTDPFSINGASG